jgi:hypothetical protein
MENLVLLYQFLFKCLFCVDKMSCQSAPRQLPDVKIIYVTLALMSVKNIIFAV